MQGTDIRQIIVHGSSDSALVEVAVKLLIGAGFEVNSVGSSDELFTRVNNGSTELMILGGCATEIGDTLDRLALLPTHQKPKTVAILSGDSDAEHTFLSRKLPGSKVHIFVSPLHAFGLLNVVKRISRKVLQHN